MFLRWLIKINNQFFEIIKTNIHAQIFDNNYGEQWQGHLIKEWDKRSRNVQF